MAGTEQQAVLRSVDAGSVERWELPLVDGTPIRAGAAPPTAERLEGIHRRAWDEGFAQGQEEGRRRGEAEAQAAGRAALQKTTATFNAIMQTMAKPLEQLDEEFEQSVADLAALIARHLVRRELRSAPGEIVAVVREAMAQLPIAARHPRIHIHPDDLEILRRSLALGDSDSAWKLEPDPLISRGGCLVETESSFVDATVEARLNAIIAKAFGGERSSDRDAES